MAPDLNESAGEPPLDVGDLVTIGSWGTRVYRVLFIVQVGRGYGSRWVTLEQTGSSRLRLPLQTVIEEVRLHRVRTRWAREPTLSTVPPRPCPECGELRRPAEDGQCPDCGVPI